MNYEEQLEQSIAQYREQQAGLVEFQRALGNISCSATAPRQVVTVSVGCQGEVTSLRFPTDAYKRMVPAELSEVILATINEARAQAMDEYAELLSPLLPEGINAKDIVTGKADLGAMLPADPFTGTDTPVTRTFQ
ncbi:YbaB/EbfC family nucleoid-associated protein [Amycolatopsis sp. H20-H5]|uniref:YbaB/EbfC family nucleoid-associated protein n=1 Tax=Amycolatopsis sp. H20-H5 TaxID=3046309 RepID=UPI002DB5E1AC|nr:YbaB/EbfC family nucleoid-associated protein [Amycolatopsis sp. H20-H5]MEC3975214.1 YbaB/EbfC family nucleoid-associated protein [Amycolatopsis sp. H20-H5]